MKQGLTLQELATELDRQSKSKLDLVADTREMALTTPAREEVTLTEEGAGPVLRGDGAPTLTLPGRDGWGMTDHAQRQLADRIGVPFKVWSRLRGDHPDLLDGLINPLLEREPKRRMLRVLDGNVRAVLSDRYRRLDNDELLAAIVPGLGALPGARIESCQVTEQRMYLKVVTERQAAISEGDVVQAGVVISNSEVGSGSLRVQPLVFRLVCLNGMVAGTALRKLHVGRAAETDDTYAILSDEAREAGDKALFLALRDATVAAVSDATFEALVAQMRQAAGSPPMADPVKGVEVLAKRIDLSESEQGMVMRHLIEGGDVTRFGLLNSVTRTAQDVESYDRASELEEAGGDILAWSDRAWAELAGATA